MTHVPIPPAPEAGDAGVYATWTHVCSGAIRGLTHALGNRLHSLEMTMGSLAPGETVVADTTDAVEAESAACAELARLYRMLPLATNAELEASRVADILPDALALFRHHLDTHSAHCDVRIDGEPPAILIAPLALTQALLVLTCTSAAGAGEGAEHHIRIHVAGAVDAVHIDIRCDDGARDTIGDHARRAAQWLLRAAHADVTHSDSPAGVVTRVAIPSLAAARRRQREGV